VKKRYCGFCHSCGFPLRVVLDGEEWCPHCKTYRRYRSHGWVGGQERKPSPCFESFSDATRLRHDVMLAHFGVQSAQRRVAALAASSPPGEEGT